MSLKLTIEEIINSDTSGLLGTLSLWPRKKISDVAVIQNGFAFSSANFSKKKGFPLIRIRDVLRNSTETFYDGSYDNNYVVKNGDCRISNMGTRRFPERGPARTTVGQLMCG